MPLSLSTMMRTALLLAALLCVGLWGAEARVLMQNGTTVNATTTAPVTQRIATASPPPAIKPLSGFLASIVPGRFLVTLRPGMTKQQANAAINGLAANHTLTVMFRWSGGFAFRKAGNVSELLAKLATQAAVSTVEPESYVRPALATAASAGNELVTPSMRRIRLALPRVGGGFMVQPSAASGTNATGPVVAVIDTGVDASHPDLRGCVIGGQSFVNEDPLSDGWGHGTAVAGIIAARNGNGGMVGGAPGVRILSLQAIPTSGQGMMSATVAAVVWAATQGRALGVRVINMSLTGGVKSAALCAAVAQASAAGITVVVAAGNAGQPMALQSPGDCPQALVVTAFVDSDGRPGGEGVPGTGGSDDSAAGYSNYGGDGSQITIWQLIRWIIWQTPVVDTQASRIVSAPGSDIVAPMSGPGCGRWPCSPLSGGGAYTTMSGTSAAAPHVAAVAARCYATGACGAAAASEAPGIVAASKAYAVANGGGFMGDPYNGLSLTKYYGFAVDGSAW